MTDFTTTRPDVAAALNALTDLMEAGAAIRVRTEGNGNGAALLTAALAPTVSLDPWDSLRFILRPLISWPELVQDGHPPAFSLQDCRLRGVPAYGHFTEQGTYEVTTVFEEHITIQPANDREQYVISLWTDFLASRSEEERAIIESQESY